MSSQNEPSSSDLPRDGEPMHIEADWELPHAESDDDELVDPEFLQLLDELDQVNGGDALDRPDLYAVLGVSRQADGSEIRAAYKRLCLLFHPDRHVAGAGAAENAGVLDGSSRRSFRLSAAQAAGARAAFERVSNSYAVLSDPSRRTIYDTYGHDGLQTVGWEMMSCEKSAPELRLEYLKLKAKNREERQLQLTQPASEFSLGLNMTDVFDRYLKEPFDERIIRPSVNVYELSIAQSVTAGLTMQNSVSLAGQVTAHNGLGIGAWYLMWRHYCGKKSILSSATVDTELSYGRAGRGVGFGVRLRRAFGSVYTGVVGFSVTTVRDRVSTLSLIPAMSTGLTVQLSSYAQARLNWKWNLEPGITSELVWAAADNRLLARVTARLSAYGRIGLGVGMEKTVSWQWLSPPRGSVHHPSDTNTGPEPRRQPAPDWAKGGDDWNDDEEIFVLQQQSKQGRLLASVEVNTVDLAELSIGAQCSVSENSRLSGSLFFSLAKGVTVKLGLIRGSQTYSLPIQLSERPDVVATGYGLVIPLVVFAAVRSLVYEPYLTRQLERAQTSRRAQLRGELTRRRHEALAIQQLMQHTADRSRAREDVVGGLAIVRAVYGFMVSSAGDHRYSDIGGPTTVDVSIPIQAMVSQSQLLLPPGRWSDLQGFYDPCLGLVKALSSGYLRQLKVVYRFHGRCHEVTVDESQGLAIPMTKHQI